MTVRSVCSLFKVCSTVLDKMNLTRIYFFITFAIFISVTAAELNDTDIKELQKDIRDYIKPDGERKTNDTLDSRFKKYADAVKEARHRNITANPVVTGLAEYSRNHPYYKDYLRNSNCTNKVKMNECKNRKLDKKVNVTIHEYRYPPSKNTPNFVKLVVDPEKHIKYTVASCNKAKILRNCIAKEALNNCDNNTRTFILDIQDFLYDRCVNTTRNEEALVSKGLSKTTSIVLGCVGCLFFLILMGGLFACYKRRSTGTHTVA